MPTEPLLIHPPPYLYSGRDPFAHVGDVVPIGLLSIAEYLRSRGWEPTLLRLPVIGRMRAQSRDGTLRDDDWDAILRVALERHPARVIGIQCHWTHYAEGALDVAGRIRALDPSRFVLLGGVHAASLGFRLLEECDALDAIVVGEGELPMDRLLQSLESLDPSEIAHRRLPRAEIPGLLTRGESGATRGVAPSSADSALLPKEQVPPLRFDLSLLEPAHGAVFIGVPVVRGLCPKPCTYCELNNRELFPRKQALLDDALEEQISHAARAKVPLYLPENFIGARPFARLLRRLHGFRDAGPIYVDCHPDMLSDEAVDALGEVAASGTRLRLWLGLESGSREVRRRAGREYDETRIFALRDRLLQAGIRPTASFLVGLPGEGPNELLDTRGWIARWNESGLIADVFPALAFPGTSLFRNPERHGITLRMERARDFARLSRGWFAPLASDPLTHGNGQLDEAAVVAQVLSLRLEQRQRLGAPLAQEAFTFMGHPAAVWDRDQWVQAIASLEPYWPAGIERPSLPTD